MRQKPGILRGTLGENNEELFLDRIAIHVGETPERGSEHLINGKTFGMELQFFFTPMGTEGPLDYWDVLAHQKLTDEDTLSAKHHLQILSILVNVNTSGADRILMKDFNKDQYEATKAIELLSQAAYMFWLTKNMEKHRGVMTQPEDLVLSLEDFFELPTSGNYYTYEGSLTHPPCTTGATWVVFETPITITHEQWQKFAFANSEFSDNKFLAGNFRPVESIQVKVPYLTYFQMREVEGIGDPEQLELELSGKNPNYTVVKKYTDFTKYFARNVRKMQRNYVAREGLADDHDYGSIVDMLKDNHVDSVKYSTSLLASLMLLTLII